MSKFALTIGQGDECSEIGFDGDPITLEKALSIANSEPPMHIKIDPKASTPVILHKLVETENDAWWKVHKVLTPITLTGRR